MDVPRGVRIVSGVFTFAGGVVLMAIQSLDPIFGVSMTDPVSLVFLGVFGAIGLGLAVWPNESHPSKPTEPDGPRTESGPEASP